MNLHYWSPLKCIRRCHTKRNDRATSWLPLVFRHIVITSNAIVTCWCFAWVNRKSIMHNTVVTITRLARRRTYRCCRRWWRQPHAYTETKKNEQLTAKTVLAEFNDFFLSWRCFSALYTSERRVYVYAVVLLKKNNVEKPSNIRNKVVVACSELKGSATYFLYV